MMYVHETFFHSLLQHFPLIEFCWYPRSTPGLQTQKKNAESSVLQQTVSSKLKVLSSCPKSFEVHKSNHIHFKCFLSLIRRQEPKSGLHSDQMNGNFHPSVVCLNTSEFPMGLMNSLIFTF